MYIISSCTIFLMILNMSCTDQLKKSWNISFTPAKVTAVSGLCAFISCIFTYPNDAEPKETIMWEKCKVGQCQMLKSEKNDLKSAHVKTFETPLDKNNCSFIIKNITTEDEGEFKLRVKDAQATSRRFKIIIQDKPVLEVPPLRENETAILSCSTPSPCPETPPQITWWIMKRGGNMTEMENITLTNTESFYNSTLTFTPTSDHHKATVGCNVSYGNEKNISTRKTIEVMYKPVLEVPPLRENETAVLNCSTPSSCPKTPTEITWWIKTREEEITEVKNDFKLTTAESFCNSNLTFTPTSDHHKATVGCNVSYGDKKIISTSKTIEVMYVHPPRILGNNKVKVGDTLNCSVDSHPASFKPVWIFTENTNELKHISGESLTIENMQTDGEYFCVVVYKKKLLTTSINISVIRDMNDTTNGTISPETSENTKNQNMTENTTTHQNGTSNTTDNIKVLLQNVDLKTIFTFLTGMATSAVVFFVILCCWVCCNRTKKHKVQAVPSDSAVNLKTMQTNFDLTVTNEQTPLHNQSDEGMSNTQMETTGEAEDNKAGEAEENKAGGPEENKAGEAGAKDVDYAAIDYSLLKKKSPEEEENKSTDTDYAEIKRDKKEQRASENKHDHTEDQKQKEEEEDPYSNSDAMTGQA